MCPKYLTIFMIIRLNSREFSNLNSQPVNNQLPTNLTKSSNSVERPWFTAFASAPAASSATKRSVDAHEWLGFGFEGVAG